MRRIAVIGAAMLLASATPTRAEWTPPAGTIWNGPGQCTFHNNGFFMLMQVCPFGQIGPLGRHVEGAAFFRVCGFYGKPFREKEPFLVQYFDEGMFSLDFGDGQVQVYPIPKDGEVDPVAFLKKRGDCLTEGVGA